MIVIRPELRDDYSAIYTVTKSAFKGRPYADGDEQDVITRLRASGAITLSLVAMDGVELVGQVTFSPVTITSGSGQWYALGPVSVVPARQGEGIGGQLIEAGIDSIRKLGAWGCILTGNPDYYTRFGFEPAAEYCPDNEPGEFFMLKRLNKALPDGKFAFHRAFYGEVSPGQGST